MAQDVNAETLVIGKRNINLGQTLLETDMAYPPSEDTRPILTTTSDTYNLPENFIRLIQLYVTVSGIRYSPEIVWNENDWQVIKSRGSATVSDVMTHIYVRQRTFEVFPTPITAGNTMRLLYESLSKPFTAANYTTGSVTTLANLGTAVTVSGSAFTAAMIGRSFRVDSDGNWYLISAVPSATTLTLATAYQGTAISAGTEAFTIGEIPRTPAGTHHLPVIYALWKHFEGVRRDPTMANHYKKQWEEGLDWAKATYGNRTDTAVIPSQRHLRRRMPVNPNWYPQNIT